MGIADIFKGLFKKGIQISYSTGKTFDPHDQIRTDGLEDIAKKKEERDGHITKDLRQNKRD